MLIYAPHPNPLPSPHPTKQTPGDYSFAFAGLTASFDIPVPACLGYPCLEISVAVSLKQLMFSKKGGITPDTMTNLKVSNQFWTPVSCVGRRGGIACLPTFL